MIVQISLDEDRISGRAENFAHVAVGIHRRLLAAGKLQEGDVVFPVRAFFEAARSYFVINEAYKRRSGITTTSDVKKAALSMVAIINVCPFQVANPTDVKNPYVPKLNHLLAESMACSILGNSEFFQRPFDSKLHFYNALSQLRVGCLEKIILDRRDHAFSSSFQIELLKNDSDKITSALNLAYMIENFQIRK